MSPSRPSLRIRPRSAIADAALARGALTDLPATPDPRRGFGLRMLLRTIRSLGRPLEPERVIVVARAVVPSRIWGRRRPGPQDRARQRLPW